MQIYDYMLEAVKNTPVLEKEASTYLGKIIHRVPNINIRTISDSSSWRKKDSDLLPEGVGPIYLPPDFFRLETLLLETPLKKADMEVDPQDNIDFLKAEAGNWISDRDKVDSKELYRDMWEDVPNISKYADNAYKRIAILATKLSSILQYKMDSASRSFELRFPDEYCPVVWSFCLSPECNSLEASLIFRSLEVSRNLLNDLYLFCVYFGYIFTLYKEEKLFDINVTAFNIFAQDAHIIDFN